MVKYSRIALLVVLDIIIVNFSYIFAFLLRFGFDVNSNQFGIFITVYAENILPVTVFSIVGLALAGLYTSIWKYAGSEELVKIALGTLMAVVFVVTFMTMTQQIMPRGIYFIVYMLIAMLVGASRFAYRCLRDMRNPGSFNNTVLRVGQLELLGKNVSKVMVVGAGDAGAAIIKEIKQHPEYGKKVVVAVDDNISKIGGRISGVKIAGDRNKIRILSRKYNVDEIIVAIPSASKKAIQPILNECNRTRCKIKALPALIDLISEKVSISNLRDIDIEDLLGRDPVKVNLREISGYLEGKIVLVTGGGGSIGSELCRQIAKFRPRRIIALDIYENSVFELANEMKMLFPQLEFEVIIGSVRDKVSMRAVFEKYKPHVVFHAAAHKHVPLMEANAGEAILNNILGTKHMIDLANEYVVEEFVMISTDKAVNPANVMGSTKRVAEMLLQEKCREQNIQTRYSAVRFGNVLGSNGSVIPLFRKQIEKGGPVTVTHPDITRYFMTISEAVQLVIQAGAMAKGGEIFVLDMGEPVKIMDLAENLIRLSGFNPGIDIDIEITGLRPGEKLYEELLLTEEGLEKTAHDKIYVGQSLPAKDIFAEMVCGENGHTFEERMLDIARMDNKDIKEWLQKIVPNYMPQ